MAPPFPSGCGEGYPSGFTRRQDIKTLSAAVAATILLAGAAPAQPHSGSSAALVPAGTKREAYVKGLDFPVDMAHVPGTRKIFFTEKMTGKIRVLQGRRLLAEPCRDLKVYNKREQGAGGIVLHPDYATNHYLYVYFQSKVHDDNRVVRFTVANNKCTESTTIIDGIPMSEIHNGGQLEFLDGYLYVSTGDAQDPASAQDTTSLAGKILRLNPDGSVPDGNPFANEVWSFGHRNPYGLAVRHATGHLFESENGPLCDDEVNLIDSAGNYGWGYPDGEDDNYQTLYCNRPRPDSPPTIWPLWSWGRGPGEETVVPTDMVWYTGDLDAAADRLLMGTFKFGDLYSFELDAEGDPVDADVLHDGVKGIIDVASGPGGWVYYLTTNGMHRIVETS